MSNFPIFHLDEPARKTPNPVDQFKQLPFHVYTLSGMYVSQDKILLTVQNSMIIS